MVANNNGDDMSTASSNLVGDMSLEMTLDQLNTETGMTNDNNEDNKAGGGADAETTDGGETSASNFNSSSDEQTASTMQDVEVGYRKEKGLHTENPTTQEDNSKNLDVENGSGDDTDYDDSESRGQQDNGVGWDMGALAIGSLCCWCKPIPATSPGDLCARTTNWGALNKDEFFSGLTVAVAQVPETIAYALLAGIPPSWALTTGWIMCIVTSLLGGGSKIISGTTASIAVALLSLVQNEGLGYVPYAVMFASLFQVAFGALRCGEFIRFIPYPIMVGFLNAMALMTVLFQLKFFKDLSTLPEGDARTYEVQYHTNAFSVLYQGSWIDLTTATVMLIEAGVTFLIALVLQRIGKRIPIPGSFVALVLVTSMEWAIARTTGYPGRLVGDLTSDIVTPNFPMPFFMTSADSSIIIPPLNYETFKAIWPAGLSVFFISQIESLLVHCHVSDESKVGNEIGASRVALSQGIAQFLSAFLGGMGGTAMLGQSEVLIKSGGASNLATFWCGALLLAINLIAMPAVNIVPLGCIVGLMCWAAFNMIRWRAFLTILASFFPQRARDVLYLDSKVNRMDTLIMLVMLAMTFFLDVAMGAIVGIAVSAISYAWEWSHRLELEREYGIDEEQQSSNGNDQDEQTTGAAGMVTYRLKGTIFFATANKLLHKLTTQEIVDDPEEVVLLMSEAEVFDWSGMLALKKLHDKIQDCGKSVAISTLTANSKAVMEKSSAMWEGVVFFEIEDNNNNDGNDDGSDFVKQIMSKRSGLDSSPSASTYDD